MSSLDNRRLFLALWPAEAERGALAEIAQSVAGRRAVKSTNLHLTLVFMGATSPEKLACYERALEDLAVPSLTLSLDQLGYWPKPRILWLGTRQAPLALITLVLDLSRRLEACGFTPERRPFSPHVTLARRYPGLPSSELLREPVAWKVDQIVLAESVRQPDGTHYQVLRRWPKD